MRSVASAVNGAMRAFGALLATERLGSHGLGPGIGRAELADLGCLASELYAQA